MDGRKLILAALLLLAPLPALAGNVAMVAGGHVNGTVTAGDSCTGGLIFSWHMEDDNVTLGTPAGCSAGDTSATRVSGANLYTTNKHDGTYSLNCPTAGDRVEFDNANIISRTAGTLIIYFRLGAFINNAYLFAAQVDDEANDFRIRFNGTDDATGRELRLDFTDVAFISDFDLSLATWYKLTVKWTTSDVNPNFSMQIDAGSPATNNTNPAPMTGTMGALTFGDYGAIGGYDVDFDAVEIWESWQ